MENDPSEGIREMTPTEGIRDHWQDFVVTPTEGIRDHWQDFVVTPTEGIRDHRWKARPHRGNYAS